MKKLILFLLLLTSFNGFSQLVGKKDSQLDAATSLSSNDDIRILQGGISKRAKLNLLNSALTPTTYVNQTGAYVVPDFTAIDGACQYTIVRGNSINTIAYPSLNASDNTPKWITDGSTLDNTQVNAVFACAYNGHIYANLRKSPLGTGADVTAPTLLSASTNSAGTISTYVFSEALNTSITPSTSDFTFSPSRTPSNVTVTGSTVQVTHPAFVNGNTIAGSYTQGTNKIQDLSGNFAASFSGYSITNNVPVTDVTPPTYSIQTVTGITSTTAVFNARINENGFVKWIVTSSSTAPASYGAIDAGTGAVASNFGSQAMTAGVTNSSASISGLTVLTTYYLYSYAIDASGNKSAIQTGINFTTTTGSISDSFTRADNTSTMGTVETPSTAWSPSTSSTWGIISNKAYCVSAVNSGTTTVNIAQVETGISNYTYTCDITYATSTVSNQGLVFRYTDASNHWFLQIVKAGGVWTANLFKDVSGTYTQVGTALTISGTPTTDTWQVITSGSSITTKRNGTTVTELTVTDSYLSTATKAGLLVLSGLNQSDNTARFDNLTIN